MEASNLTTSPTQGRQPAGSVHWPAVHIDSLIKAVSDNIGKNWPLLARSLGFNQTDIDHIEYAHPHNLKEQIFQMFHEWKRRDGNEATTDKLIAALIQCHANLELKELLETLERKGYIQKSESPAVPEVPRLVTTTPSSSQSRLDPSVIPDSAHSSKQSPSCQHAFSKQAAASGPDRDVNDLNLDDKDCSGQNKYSANLINNLAVLPYSTEQKPNIPTVQKTDPKTFPEPNQPVHSFEVDIDDRVMVERTDAASWYGVVRWIGELPEIPGEPVAGIEMDDEVPGGGNGSINGKKYFWCQNKHGLFLPVARINKVDGSPSAAGSLNTTGENNTATHSDNESNAAVQFKPSYKSEPSSKDTLKQLTEKGLSPCPGLGTEVQKVLTFFVPADQGGFVIGQGGRNIKKVQQLTNTTINVENDSSEVSAGNRVVCIRGTEENQKKALKMIRNNLRKRIERYTTIAETHRIPESKVGLVIGRKGQTKNAIKRLSGVVEITIADDPPAGPEGLSALLKDKPRECTIRGSEEAVKKAKELIDLTVQGKKIDARAGSSVGATQGDNVTAVEATMATLIADLALFGVKEI